MKRIQFLFVAILLIINISYINAQNIVFTPSQYPNIDFEKYYRIKSEETKKLRAEMEDVQKKLINLLAMEIDTQMRISINDEYNKLSAIMNELDSKGLSSTIRSKFNTCKQRINQKMVDYNNRIAQEQQLKIEEEARRKAIQESEIWSGTGFALKNNYIVTNYHVVKEAKFIYIQGINGNFSSKHHANIIATDKFNDLAILKIDDNIISNKEIPYSVKTSTSEVGEDVFVLGYPLTSTMGEEIKLTTGIVSSKTGFQGDVSLYQISAPIQPGNSGGPLFDEYGNIIGIVSAKHKNAENVGYAIKASYLRILMESALSESVLPQTNKIADFKLSDKVKSLKNYVYYITCSRTNNNISTNESTNINYNESSTSSTDKIYYNPHINMRISNSLKIISIKIQDNLTAITFSNNNRIDDDSYYQWFTINKNAYISANNQRYTLIKTDGIAIFPNKTYYSYAGETKTFTLYFPAIPKSTTSIDFIEAEDSDWRLYGIQLK